jgi:hypothetical protein
LRGTRFRIGDLDYLYTTGFIPALNEFHGVHVPSPVQVSDHVGKDTSREQLLREVLLLTKLNWNSAMFCGKLPVTLKFAELVDNIMKEIPRRRNRSRNSSSIFEKAYPLDVFPGYCNVALRLQRNRDGGVTRAAPRRQLVSRVE